MPVPNSMADLFLQAGSNSPAGTESIGNSLDNYLRAHGSIVRSIYATSTASLAAASTVDLATSDAERVVVTGTASITSFGTGFVGCKREVIFTGTPTIVHSASIYLPGLANITVAANDILTLRCTGSGQWTLVNASRPLSLGLTAVVGFTPINKAGDTGIGNLSITGTLSASGQIASNTALVAGASGALGKLNVGFGRSYFGPNSDLFAIGVGYNDTRAQAGQVGYIGASDSGTPDTVFSNAGGTEQARLNYSGGLTLANGRKLLKITLSSAAPGTLADGELYLRY